MFVWGGHLRKVVQMSTGWTFQFYGITFGQFGIGIILRQKEGKDE